VDQEIKQNLVEEANNKNNSLRKSIEILAEMTRANIERSSLYFDSNHTLETQRQKIVIY